MIWNQLTEEYENPPASPGHESNPPSPSRRTSDTYTPPETVDPTAPGLGQHRNRGLGGPMPPHRHHHLCGPDCSIDNTLGWPRMGGLSGIGGSALGQGLGGLGGSTLGRPQMGGLGGMGGMGVMGDGPGAFGFASYERSWRHPFLDSNSEGLGRREDGSLRLFTSEEVVEMEERRRKQVEDLLALKLGSASGDEEAGK